MKKVIVLGAGLVAGPLVDYLVKAGFDVTVADMDVEKTREMAKACGVQDCIEFDISRDEGLCAIIRDKDAVVSLLPYTLHPTVARACIVERKNMITTSYVSEEMRSLDQDAKDAGIILLNEMGLDPGIDHMEAQRVIDMVHENGGSVEEFISYCGGLPSQEDNTNPWGYKFSWSPRGVVLASKNDAMFKREGEIVEVPGKELFANFEIINIPGLGEFEGYPNRNSIPYGDVYGIHGSGTILRGTLRNLGWCDTWKALHDIGILEESPTEADTYIGLMNELIPGKNDLKTRVNERISTRDNNTAISNWEWLGLFSDEPLPRKDSMMDSLSDLLKKKLVYENGEKDMIILQHSFKVKFNEEKKTIRSTMVAIGEPDGRTAMSMTVGLPAAIGTELVLNGELEGRSGVIIPTSRDIYIPTLEKLKTMGIEFTED